MRTLWIALLIALLPVRGWVGDAMAVDMMPAPAHPAAGQIAEANVHADCPHAAAATAAAAHQVADHHGPAHHGDAAHTDHAGASAHLLCDVCNGPALSTATPATAATAVEHGLLVERKQSFASQAPRQVVKPPIA